MYFKLFMLNPIKVNITFNMMPSTDDPSSQTAKNPLRILTQLLGTTIANIDNAPIGLNALIVEDAFGSSDELVSRITTHYTRQGIQEVYKILGSAEFLGNPVGLFNNIGTGFKDFFFEPAQGFIKSPEEFGKGLAKGTLSLVKHSVYGTFNTVSKLSGAVGKGIATLSFDPEYIQKRQVRHVAEKPKHFGEGLLYGFKDLGTGMFDGLSGIVTQPVKGARKEGALGFVKGLGRGFIGMGIKPVVGAIDLVSRTTEGIRNTTTIGDKETERNRLPRHFGPDKILEEYTSKEAQGSYYLDNVDQGVFKNEKYIHHEQLDDDTVVVISEKRVVQLDKNSFVSNWMIEVKYIVEVDLTELGVLIKFEREPEFAIIDCRDQTKAMILMTKIGATTRAARPKRTFTRTPKDEIKQ